MRSAILIIVALTVTACSQAGNTGKKQSAERRSKLPPATYTLALPQGLRTLIDKPFKGDFEAMVNRRLIRVAAPFNRTFYFVDKGVERGLSYEYVKLFEDRLNKQRKAGALKVYVVVVPMPRDMLIPALNAGRVDMVVAQLTITPDRMNKVDFSNPTRTPVNEIVVTAKGAPPIDSPEQLSGHHVLIRKSSSYFQSIQALNQRLARAGRAPVIVDGAPESLEDDDLLEMVNAGLVPATIVDDYLAQFWKQVFANLILDNRAVVRADGQLAVAIRKKSPQLKAALNHFISEFVFDTAMWQTLNKRYLHDTKYVQNAASDEEREKFLTVLEPFRKYGAQYRLDALLMAAQGYQESRLDQNAKSPVGAIGVMQLMPATGQQQNVGDIHQLDPNVHAGVKYMRFMMDRYFEDQPMDPLNKRLFTFASYNAGPALINQLRGEASARGLNPNIWFGNVEQIASERIGRQTVTYVSNIYKYYVAYSLFMQQLEERKRVKASVAATFRKGARCAADCSSKPPHAQ